VAEPYYDPYWYYAQPQHRHYWGVVGTLADVRLADVTCIFCGYHPRSTTFHPRKAYTAHMRKKHRAQWDLAQGRVFVISEEPDGDVYSFPFNESRDDVPTQAAA
jgi:hypothetical protein